MAQVIQAVLIFLMVIMIASCGILDIKKQLYEKSLKNKAIPFVIYTPSFNIQAVKKVRDKGEVLRIYIEGDGYAGRNRRLISDPSPRSFTLLSLMLADPFPEKVYIARPCQFIKTDQCSSRWWTQERYSSSVVNSLNHAISNIKKTGQWKYIELTGFSGGGTIALLLAAQRNDIISVKTIGGNLAPAFANALHGASPEPDALRPLEFIKKLEKIPQIHYIGEKDTIVPATVFKYYIAHMKNKRCVKYKIIKGATHTKGWLDVWPVLAKEKANCD